MDVEAKAWPDPIKDNRKERNTGLSCIRQLEAAVYGSRTGPQPPSKQGDMALVNMSSTTLLGGASTPKLDKYKMDHIINSLPPAHIINRHDSLPVANSMMKKPRRKTPPAIRLAPSDAELSGRINHNGTFQFPPKSTSSNNDKQLPPSPAFGSDCESDGWQSPISPSFKPDEEDLQNPPQIPMPAKGFRVSFVSVYEKYRSRCGSLILLSPTHSIPPSPVDNDGFEPPDSPQYLLPMTYQPPGSRDRSDSGKRSNHRKSRKAGRKSYLSTAAGNDARQSAYSDIYDAYYEHDIRQ